MLREFLSLEDVARILGVDYKTVYRLVRSGKLSAGKVGRVYRVRPEDLEAYFESTKTHAPRPLPAVDTILCCVTGKRIVSELDIGGYCAESGLPICKAAWSSGARTAVTPDSPDSEEQTP